MKTKNLIKTESAKVITDFNLIQHYLLSKGENPFKLSKQFKVEDVKKFPIVSTPVYFELIPDLQNDLFTTGIENDPYGILEKVNKQGFPRKLSIPEKYRKSQGVLVMYKISEGFSFGTLGKRMHGNWDIEEFIGELGCLLGKIFGLTDISIHAYNYIASLKSKNLLANGAMKSKIFVSELILCQEIERDFYKRNDSVMLYFDSLPSVELIDFSPGHFGTSEESQKEVEMLEGDYVAYLFAENPSGESKTMHSMDLKH